MSSVCNRQPGVLSVPLPVVLLAEDDQLMQSLVEETLIEGGFEIAIAATGEVSPDEQRD